jgi:hypothetical protein
MGLPSSQSECNCGLGPKRYRAKVVDGTGFTDDGGHRASSRANDKSRRRAAREQVAAYHQARLDELIRHVATAVDGWRTGSLDAHDLDEVLHHYQRAAHELWKFCWSTGGGGHIEMIAAHLNRLAEDNQIVDWWERGAPHRRSGT